MKEVDGHMKCFCMPADFKSETIDLYKNLNDNYVDFKVTETYGQLTEDFSFTSGRLTKEIPSVGKKQFKLYVQYSRDKNIDFNYTLNASCMSNEELTKTGYEKIKELLNYLESVGVRHLTVSLPSLIEIIRYINPDMKITASIIMRLDNSRKVETVENLGVERIMLSENINRNFTAIRNIRKVSKTELEIIVNSSCINNCPFSIFHYNFNSHGKDVFGIMGI